MLEAETACALQQQHLVVQLAEHTALHEMLYIAEEVLVGYGYLHGLLRHLVANADETVDATLHTEVGHLTIERGWGLTTLIDVAQHECLATATTAHEVEGYIERVDIGVVGVVDKGQSALSLLHFQAHGYRLQSGHALSKVFRRESQIERRSGTGHAVRNRSLVNERNGVFASRTFIYIGDGGAGVLRVL